jgi:hypothetical protein
MVAVGYRWVIGGGGWLAVGYRWWRWVVDGGGGL